MKTAIIITHEELCEMLREEQASKREYLEPISREERNGLLYGIWEDARSGKRYAVREIRSVSMGFNSNEDGKVDEFVAIVEREGMCKARWGVTGRTAHELLARKLERELPQYEFEIGYNYHCVARKR